MDGVNKPKRCILTSYHNMANHESIKNIKIKPIIYNTNNIIIPIMIILVIVLTIIIVANTIILMKTVTKTVIEQNIIITMKVM